MNNGTYLSANLNHEVCIELPRSSDESQKELILIITNKGVEFTFYDDCHITSTLTRTYEELNEWTADAVIEKSEYNEQLINKQIEAVGETE